MIKSSLLLFILFLSLGIRASEVPIARDFLKLSDGRWIWLKKVDVHKTWVLLGKGEKSVRNKIWSKFYESDGIRHAWSYAFFVKLKLDQFVLPDAEGNPQVAVATYSMGNSEMSSVIIYRLLKDRLEIVDERDNFNVAADESVFEKKPVPRDMNPHFKVPDIQKWVGQYPFSKVEGAPLFSIKAINDYLKNILGDSKYNEFLLIEDIGPQSPVESNEGVIHFTVCQKHNCDHMFYFLFKITSGQLIVCERELNLNLKSVSAPHSQRATWFSEKGKHIVPEDYCEFYDENKKEIDWKRTYERNPFK